MKKRFHLVGVYLAFISCFFFGFGSSLLLAPMWFLTWLLTGWNYPLWYTKWMIVTFPSGGFKHYE